MTAWKRKPRISPRFRRWINQVQAGVYQWAQRTRRLHEACLALSQARRRRCSVRLCLEGLEDRELLDANVVESAADVLRNEVPTSTAALTAPPPLPATAEPSSPAAVQPLVVSTSDALASSSVNASIMLQRASGGYFTSSVHGTIGSGIFTFTGSVTTIGGITGLVNEGDTVSGSISGFSSDGFDGNDNFNMIDETTGSSFLNGGATGDVSNGSISGYIGAIIHLPQRPRPQWQPMGRIHPGHHRQRLWRGLQPASVFRRHSLLQLRLSGPGGQPPPERRRSTQ